MLYHSFISSLLSKGIYINSDIIRSGDTTTISSINDISNLEYKHISNTLVISDSSSTDWPSYASLSYYKFKKLDLQCPKLTTFKFVYPENSVYVQPFEFLEEVSLPSSVTQISENAFQRSPIKTINLDKVTQFGSNCFSYCPNLEKLTLNAATIPSNFANNCPALKEVVLTASSVTIGKNAFQYCPSLTTIDFTKITAIEEYSFAYTGFTSLSLSGASVGNYAFAYTPLLDVKFSAESNVGTCAFKGTFIKSVTMPITSAAPTISFANCYLLEDATFTSTIAFTIPKECFLGCYSLKKVTCENAVTVGEKAFFDCINLTTIEGSKITSYGTSALENCENLDITINTTTTTYGEKSFANCRNLKLTEVSTNTASFAFIGCTGITKLQLFNSVSEYMFAVCTSLESITIGQGCNQILEFAFANCTKLSSITINGPSSVAISTGAFSNDILLVDLKLENASISSYAFQYSGIKTITMGANSDAEALAFSRCEDLEKITISKDCNTFTPNFIFGLEKVAIEFESGNVNLTNKDGVLYDKNNSIVYVTPEYEGKSLSFATDKDKISPGALYNNKNIKQINVTKRFSTKPDYYQRFTVELQFTAARYIEEVTISIDNYSDPIAIPENCFSACTNLKKLTIVKGVTSIGQYAFMGCTSLKEISMPDNITLNSYAFAFCTSLKSISLPLIVEGTTVSILMGCTKLNDVEFHPSQAFIPKNMFKYSGIKKITIPDSITSINDYAFACCSKLSKFTLGKGFQDLTLNISRWFIQTSMDESEYSIINIAKMYGIKIDDEYFMENTNFTFKISSTISTIAANTFSNFAYIDVEVDKENPYFKVDSNCIINKFSNKLVTTFGVLDTSFTISSDVEFATTAIYKGQATVFSDATGQTFTNDPQVRQLVIPSSVKEISSTLTTNNDDIRSICYEGKYFQTAKFTKGNVYAASKYVFPTIFGKTRNTNCQTDYLPKDNARHLVGMTGAEIGLTVVFVLFLVLLVIVIILYIFVPLTNLIMKAATE